MAFEEMRKEHYGIADLLRIMEILRGEGGCPWDREQDHHSIRNNMIEEAYEAVEAIDTEDRELLLEELGDVLMQVVFHARIEEEQGSFNFEDVCDGVCKKLVRRHPHVFGTGTADNTEEVLVHWDAIKKEEHHQTTAASTLESVARSMPALMRGAKVAKRAAKAGFELCSAEAALGQVRQCLTELEAAVREQDTDAEQTAMGEFLFSAANLSRMLGQEPEEELTRATDRFIGRFAEMERQAEAGRGALNQYSAGEMQQLWQNANKKK